LLSYPPTASLISGKHQMRLDRTPFNVFQNPVKSPICQHIVIDLKRPTLPRSHIFSLHVNNIRSESRISPRQHNELHVGFPFPCCWLVLALTLGLFTLPLNLSILHFTTVHPLSTYRSISLRPFVSLSRIWLTGSFRESRMIGCKAWGSSRCC